jgi:serine/threonine protein kinase/Tfp pilus assembly protein PilF
LTIDSGTKIGRYEVRSPIGAGGMGEVYLALDTELDRTVAIKILPETLATDEQRLQRFVQEAKAASALNHPHILTIHEIGTIGGSRFIATEFIDGDTLRQRIDAGIKLVDILEISIQACSALAAAHAAGIIHRDIKPENIMVRRDGYIKVLDFGLAKLTGPEGSTPDAEAPTRAMVNTGACTVMGTANYMSPEQAKGVSVDVRTDLWSLGAVLYEMIAAHVPFAGETPTETLSLILQKEPPALTRFAHDVPPELERIVTKALTKDREERYQTAKDMLIDLRNLKRRVEVDAEIDRTVPPEYRGATAGKSTGSGQSAPDTGSGSAALTSANSTSSAEYIVSGMKQHKLATSVAAGLVVIVGAVGLFLYLRARSEQGAIESIAVMPFVNDSGNADVEYLSDGMTETLISSLSSIPNISVKARSTVFFYKGKNISAKKIGEELGVQAVLQGRFVQHGNDLKLSLELVNTETQDVLWSDQFNRKMGDLVSLQSEVAKQVADKIGARLSGEEQNKVARTYTNNPQAYQAYLKGRYYWNQRVEEGLRKGIEYFRQAIELDPNYALAWSGLADSYFILPEYGSYSVNEYLPKAKQAAENAIELDANLAEAQTSLAYIEHTYDWKFAEAEKRYKKAIELNPNYATAYQWYAELLLQQRRFDEAQNTAKKSVELEPLSMIENVVLGETYCFAKQYVEAEQVYRKALEIQPVFAVANRQLARALVARGRMQEALIESDKAYESGAAFKFSKGVTYASAGDREDAKRFISDYKGLDARQVYDQVTIHALLGEDAEAIDGVEILFEKRSAFVLYCNVAPDLDSIRENPRFKTLMKQVGLTAE